MSKLTVDQILAYMPNRTVSDKIARIEFLKAAKAALEEEVAKAGVELAKAEASKTAVSK